MPPKNSLGMLLGFVLICFLAEALGGWLTSLGISVWYPTINKPSWTPPNWLFAPVWTLLYVLLGVSMWLVWKEPYGSSKIPAYVIFALLLLFNVAWSGLFFVLQCPLCALIEIAILWWLLVLCIIVFYRIWPLAGYLLLPYLAWVSYASALNAAVWFLNRPIS